MENVKTWMKCLRYSKRSVERANHKSAVSPIRNWTRAHGRFIVGARRRTIDDEEGKESPLISSAGEPRCRESETKWNLTAISTGLLGRGGRERSWCPPYSLGTFVARARTSRRERGRGQAEIGEIFRRWNGKWSVTAALEIQIRGPSWEGETNFCANAVQRRLNAAQPAVHAAKARNIFPVWTWFPFDGGRLPPETIPPLRRVLPVVRQSYRNWDYDD